MHADVMSACVWEWECTHIDQRTTSQELGLSLNLVKTGSVLLLSLCLVLQASRLQDILLSPPPSLQ